MQTKHSSLNGELIKKFWFSLIFKMFFPQIKDTVIVTRTVRFPFLILLYNIYHSAKKYYQFPLAFCYDMQI